jgi:hypothetical protein
MPAKWLISIHEQQVNRIHYVLDTWIATSPPDILRTVAAIGDNAVSS